MYNSRRSHPVDNDGGPIENARILVSLPGNHPSGPGNASADSWQTGACAWSSDGRYFAWASSHRLIKIVPQSSTTATRNKESNDNNEQNAVVTIDAGDKVWCMAFGSRSTRVRRQSNLITFRYVVFDDTILAAGLQNGRIRTWDVKTGCLKLDLIDHTGIISDLSFALDGSLRLVSASHDSTLKLWDFEDGGNLIRTLKSKAKINGCAWSPDSKMVASVGDRKTVELWNMETYTLISRFEGHHHTVSKCDFSPDGALLATASFDSRVIIWDVLRALPILELCHLKPAPSLIYAGGENGAHLRSVSFSPDGKHLGSVCIDGFVRIWDIFEPDVPVRVADIEDASFCRFSPGGGGSLAVGTTKGKALIFESPRRVTSLQRMCRLTVRRLLSSDKVDMLSMIPRMMQKFLSYDQL